MAARRKRRRRSNPARHHRRRRAHHAVARRRTYRANPHRRRRRHHYRRNPSIVHLITGSIGDSFVIVGGELVARAVPSLVGLSAQSVYVQAAAGVVVSALAGVLAGKVLGAQKAQLLTAAGLASVEKSVLKGLNVPYVSAYLGDGCDDLALSVGSAAPQGVLRGSTVGGYPRALNGYPDGLSGYGKTASEDVVAESFGDGESVALSGF